MFIADLTSNGSLSAGTGRGVIYQIKSLALPPIQARRLNEQVELTWNDGVLQAAEDVSGPWDDVLAANRTHLVVADGCETNFLGESIIGRF